MRKDRRIEDKDVTPSIIDTRYHRRLIPFTNKEGVAVFRYDHSSLISRRTTTRSQETTIR